MQGLPVPASGCYNVASGGAAIPTRASAGRRVERRLARPLRLQSQAKPLPQAHVQPGSSQRRRPCVQCGRAFCRLNFGRLQSALQDGQLRC